MKIFSKNPGQKAMAIAFTAAFGFFQFAYPYHLMRREQLTLFPYDWRYISQNYQGTGCIARFIGDFLDQFFCFPIVGPLIIALLLTAIGAVVYRICRKFMGKWPSLAVGAAFIFWSFMRETENQYITRYTVVVLGFLALVLAALQFRKIWMKAIAAVVFLAAGAWGLGSPVHQYYGRLWGKPLIYLDRMIGLDVEVSRENWDKVLRIAEKDLHINEASFCYNLANAMKGKLPEALLNYTQNGPNSLFLWVLDQNSQFSNCIAGEVWYQLGDMTLAEQSAIIALQASPNHNGARYVLRLAQVNLISGQYAAAQKYLNLLSRTLVYGKRAKKMYPGSWDSGTEEWLTEKRKNLAEKDFVYDRNEIRPILQGLLEANPDNLAARNYLLCYDLMCFDLNTFIADYCQKPVNADIYQEAILIWLNLTNGMNEENFVKYGVSKANIDRLGRFYAFPNNYRNTYWDYYMNSPAQ